jgi:hypothetical protein
VRILIPIAVLALLALAAAGFATGHLPWQGQTHLSVPPPLTTHLALDQLACASQAEWSPNGQQIAVLAGEKDCPESAPASDVIVVALLDPRGQLLRTLDVESIVLGKRASLNTSSTPTPTVSSQPSGEIVQYSNLSWSPDGSELAVTYLVQSESSNSANGGIVDEGVALVRADGSGGKVLHQPTPGFTGVWDLQTGRATNQNLTQPPQAIAFVWAEQDQLMPAPLSGSPIAPIGNPIGGQLFTAWQPGSIGLDSNTKALIFTTQPSAWSPDGRYLVPGLALSYNLAQSGPNLQPASGGIPTARYRDLAMQHVALGLKGLDNPQVATVPLAWRPDGTRLAALVPDPAFYTSSPSAAIPNTPERVGMYDCTTGNQLTVLTTTRVETTASTESYHPEVHWSPDGSHVLLLDTGFDILTIWGPQQLPKG